MGKRVAVFDYSQKVMDIFTRYADVVAVSVFHDFTGNLAAYVSDFTLQIADARFTRVGANQRSDSFICKLDVLVSQASLHHLLLDQELLGDLDFFLFGVTVQPKHFHAVLQSGRNSVHHVSGSHKEYLREVVLHVEIVINKHEILFGIKHFEKCRRRIAAEIHGHLVHFIEHEDGILGARLLHHLDNLPRQRTDVGATMAANFSFVSNASERHANELAPGSFGDGHPQRSLANAGRSYKAENRTFRIFYQLPHSKKFKNAFFDLFETVVIFV